MISIIQRKSFAPPATGSPASFTVAFDNPVTAGSGLVLLIARSTDGVVSSVLTDKGDVLSDVDITNSILPFGAGTNTVDAYWCPSATAGATQIILTTGSQACIWAYEVGHSGVLSVAQVTRHASFDSPFTGPALTDTGGDGSSAYFSIASLYMGDSGVFNTVAAPWALDTPYGGTINNFFWDLRSAQTAFGAAFLVGTGTQTAAFDVTTAPDTANPAPLAGFVLIEAASTPNFPAPPGGDRFIPKPSLLAGPVQNIPLDNSPNQVWRVTVTVSGAPVTLLVVLRYNEIAKYWVATIRDSKNNLILDSLPFVTGDGISQNLLSQFAYLGIGSATVFNASQLA